MTGVVCVMLSLPAGLAIAEGRLSMSILVASATGPGTESTLPTAGLLWLAFNLGHWFCLKPPTALVRLDLGHWKPPAQCRDVEVKGRLNIADTPEGSYFYRPSAQ